MTDGEIGMLLPLGLLATGLGVLEAALVFWRRWIQSSAVLGIESAMRRDFYYRLQQLPLSFHTQWQSGQLLSRGTTDLAALRRFSGFGMIFLAAAAVPIVVLSMRFERTYVVISRRVQDEQGDLATLAEEGAVGVRVIKSFGRSEHVARQYEASADRFSALHAAWVESLA